MSIYEQAFGKAYVRDDSCGALTGRVTYQHTIKGITLDGWVVEHTVSYIDLGRAAPVDAVDPDAQLQPERFRNSTKNADALEGIRIATLARAAALVGDVEACLAEHGPQSASGISRHLGNVSNLRVQGCLRGSADRFVFRGGASQVWSLVGQEYNPPKVERVSKQMVAVREVVLTHGPQMSRDIARHMGRRQVDIDKCLNRYPECFCVVGKEKSPGNGVLAKVWGLVEAQVAA